MEVQSKVFVFPSTKSPCDMSTSTSSSASRSSFSLRGFPSPLAESAPSFEDAVHTLQERDPSDLRRARRHHRRALEALKGGCYDALSEGTRERLIQRLTSDLEVLNAALGHTRPVSSTGDGAPAGASLAGSSPPRPAPSTTSSTSNGSTGTSWTGWLAALW